MPSGPFAPGVYVGAWRIVTPWGGGYLGARHTAVALAFPDGLTQVTELLGYRLDHGRVFLRNRVVTDTMPYYGSYSSYQWVALAGPAELRRFQRAVERATQHFHGDLYAPADSNRFVADVLYHAGYTMTAAQQQALGGWVPAFSTPHR